MAALKEAIDCNLFIEYEGLRRINRDDNFSKGRLKIYEGLIKLLRNDPENGDLIEKKNKSEYKKQILLHEEVKSHFRQGGELLNIDNNMRDPLFWSFIPKRFYRDIDLSFNGIGDWVS